MWQACYTRDESLSVQVEQCSTLMSRVYNRLPLCMVMTGAVSVLQATNLSQDEFTRRIDAEEIRTLVAIDYNPNKHRHIAYKPQDVMNWVLQPWYQEMLSMNHLLVGRLV